MYSHERTMLAKLGFADPDRREPLHDVACRYLSTEPAVRRLVTHLGLERGPTTIQGINHLGKVERAEKSEHFASHYATLEREISKGQGQYRTTVGFIDLTLRIDIEERCTNVMRMPQDTYHGPLVWTPAEDYTCRMPYEFAIEVKVNPTTMGDLIRQLNLYRSYSYIRDWIVATAYPLTSDDVECLKAQRLRHVQLGKHFQAYCEQQQQRNVADCLEV
jgi:hypothetical protein